MRINWRVLFYNITGTKRPRLNNKVPDGENAPQLCNLHVIEAKNKYNWKCPMQYVKILVLVLCTSLYRSKMWPPHSKFGSLYRSFRYNGVPCIRVITQTIYRNLPGPKKYFVITGALLYRGSTVIKIFLLRVGFMMLMTMQWRSSWWWFLVEDVRNDDVAEVSLRAGHRVYWPAVKTALPGCFLHLCNYKFLIFLKFCI